MNLRTPIPVLVLVVAVPALTAATCSEGGGAAPQQACNLVEAQPPTFVAGRGKGTIVAAIRAYCDPAPRRHTLTVWMEREGSDGKSWFQVGNSEKWQNVKDIPPPPPGREYRITKACIDGYWRVRARAEGLSPDGRAFTFTLPASESLIRRVRCRLQ